MRWFRAWSSDQGMGNAAVSYLHLIRLALPSMLLQSASPAAITVQTALLGHVSTDLVAGWAVVAATTNSAAVVFNFLVVGVTAKVSKAVGARAWHHVGSRIRLALLCAAAMGVLAGSLLIAIQKPVFSLLAKDPEVQKHAKQYYMLRAFGFPSQLLAMSTVGILQGYKRVYLVAALQIVRLVIEVFLSYVVLFKLQTGLWGVGLVNFGVISLSAFVAFILILNLPPKEGKGKIHVFPRCDAGFMEDMDDMSVSHAGVDWDESGASLLGSWREEQARKARIIGALEKDASLHGRGILHLADVPEEVEAIADESEKGTWEFVWDGMSTVVRSALVQISFFSVLACVSQLGKDAVAAHQIVMQLWLICTYLVDGFATAGTIVGSDIAGQMDKTEDDKVLDACLSDLVKMSWRLLYLGGIAGCGLAAFYYYYEDDVIGTFTTDKKVKEALKGLWIFLVFIQPMNAIVFIYDGLIFAAQAFSYMAVALTIGFFCFFLPTLTMAHFAVKTLASIWAAKVMLNVVRLFAAAWRIHFKFLLPRPKKTSSVHGLGIGRRAFDDQATALEEQLVLLDG